MTTSTFESSHHESAAVAFASAAWAGMKSVLARHAEAGDLIDSPSGLYNVNGLVVQGTKLLAECRRDSRPLGLMVLDFPDLLEARDIYGRDTSRKLQAHVVKRMRALAGLRGICARTGRTEFTIVVPGATREKLQSIIERKLGRPSRIEFEAGDCEIVLVPDIQSDSARTDLDSIGELYRDVSHALCQEQVLEQRRQVWLTRERERHSRPMSLPPSMQ